MTTDAHNIATGVATGRVGDAPSHDPELAFLHVFIGRWLTEGATEASAEGPPAAIVSSDVYEWAPGARFVMHLSYGRIGPTGVGGLEVIGYDCASRQYRTLFFDSQGNSISETLSHRDGIWTWHGMHARCAGFFSDGGKTLTARHERSDDGVHWVRSMTVTLRRID